MEEDDLTFYFGGPDVFDGFDLESQIKDYKSPEEVPDVIDIPLFREGVWYYPHPVNGEVRQLLNADKQFISKLVSNFNNGAYPGKLHGNVEHDPKSGAKAWVVPGSAYTKEIKFSNSLGEHSRDCVFAKVQLTQEGKEIIAGKKFRYISAELSPNYATREVFKTRGIGSRTVDRRLTKGPVMTGFAFTNKPKIDSMPELFSEAAPANQIPEGVNAVEENDLEIPGSLYAIKFSETVDEGTTEVTQPEPEATTDEPAQEDLNLSEQENTMNLAEILVKVNGLGSAKEKAEYLEAQAVDSELNFSEGDLDVIASQVNVYKSLMASEERAQNALRNLKLKESQVKDLEASVEELKLSEAALTEQAYESKVDLFVADHVAKGITPALAAVAKRVLMAAPVESRELTFSEGSEEGDAFDLMGAVDLIFSEVPKVQLDAETLETDQNVVEVTPDTLETPEPEVTEPANDLTFSEVPAHVKLYAQNYKLDLGKFIEDNGLENLINRIDENGRLKR